MRPIPVEFHIGPLQVHTYGIGLALTFWFGFTYFERRLRHNGYRTDWFVPVFLWIILSAVVGARAMHVLSNLELLHRTIPATSSPSGTAASPPSAACCSPCRSASS